MTWQSASMTGMDSSSPNGPFYILLAPAFNQGIQIVPEHLVELAVRSLDVGFFTRDWTSLGAVATFHAAGAVERPQLRGEVLDDVASALILEAAAQAAQVIRVVEGGTLQT